MKPDAWRWMVFAAGTLALFFSNGINGLAIAAWLAPVLLLIFVNRTSVWAGLGAVFLASSAAIYSMFDGAIPTSRPEYVALSLAGGCIVALPFFLHRIAAPRLGALAGSLVYPSAVTALGYISALGSPFGTWGHDAYMQTDFAPFAQLVSVVGVWGIAFGVSWFASIAALLVETRDRAALLTAGMFGLGFAAVLAFGTSRLMAPLPAGPAVQVAALNNPADLPDRFFEGCNRRDDYACRSARARARWDRLFAMSETAARNGAQLIVWYEAAAQYDEGDEPAFIARAQAFARTHKVYLVAGAARIPNAPGQLIENKALVFTPDGALAFEYLKSIPVPGEPIIAGDRRIRTLDTPFGRLGVMICFDADFPDLSRQAADRGVDLLAIPANDWRAITPLHGEMVRLRAIENGFSIVRASSNGLSVIADQRGRVLASVNSFEQPGVAATARVTAQLQPTLYGRIDDQFAGVTVLMALALLLAALGLRARQLVRRRAMPAQL